MRAVATGWVTVTHQLRRSEVLRIDSLSDLLHSFAQLSLLRQAVSVPYRPKLVHVPRPFAPPLDNTSVDLLHGTFEMRLELLGKHLGIHKAGVGAVQRVIGRRVR
jgi:hypothetical protein